MKRFSFVFLFPVLMLLTVSCERVRTEGPVPLPAPHLTVADQTGTSFSVVWYPVENASGYTYEINGEARSVTDTEAVFDGLEKGSYTVRVRADAPRHSEWTNSEFAEITVSLDGNTIAVEARDIAWNAARIVCAPNTGISYIYDILDKEFYQTFNSGEEMVASYLDYAASQGVPINMILKMGRDSTDLVGLFPDTDYVVFAVGLDADGNLLSDVFTTEFRTDVMPPVDAELEKWFGTWTAVSEQTLRWTYDGKSVSMEIVDEPKTFDVTISGDPSNYQQAYINGWASCLDYPALATVDYGGRLEVYSGVVMDAADERGLSPTWGAYSRIVKEGAEDRYSIILGQFAAYTFEMDGDSASSNPVSDTMMDGSVFTTVALDIFRMGDSGWTVYLDSEGDIPDMPAGSITLTRKASSESVPFCILRNY